MPEVMTTGEIYTDYVARMRAELDKNKSVARIMEMDGIDSGSAAGSVPVGSVFYIMGYTLFNAGAEGSFTISLSNPANNITGWLPAKGYIAVFPNTVIGTAASSTSMVINHGFGAGCAWGNIFGFEVSV